jgi:hypothetical protein
MTIALVLRKLTIVTRSGDSTQAPSDSVRQLGQLSTRGRFQPAKPRPRTIDVIDVDTVAEAHVDVKIEIQHTASAIVSAAAVVVFPRGGFAAT